MSRVADRVFKGVITVKVIGMRPYSNITGVLVKRGRNTSNVATQGKDHVRTGWEQGVYKPRTGVSAETKPADTLTLTLQPSELRENRCLPCKPPSLWDFVTAAWADWYTHKRRVRSISFLLTAYYPVTVLRHRKKKKKVQQILQVFCNFPGGWLSSSLKYSLAPILVWSMQNCCMSILCLCMLSLSVN